LLSAKISQLASSPNAVAERGGGPQSFGIAAAESVMRCGDRNASDGGGSPQDDSNAVTLRVYEFCAKFKHATDFGPLIASNVIP
jgi:hypothetical protein